MKKIILGLTVSLFLTHSIFCSQREEKIHSQSLATFVKSLKVAKPKPKIKPKRHRTERHVVLTVINAMADSGSHPWSPEATVKMMSNMRKLKYDPKTMMVTFIKEWADNYRYGKFPENKQLLSLLNSKKSTTKQLVTTFTTLVVNYRKHTNSFTDSEIRKVCKEVYNYDFPSYPWRG